MNTIKANIETLLSNSPQFDPDVIGGLNAENPFVIAVPFYPIPLTTKHLRPNTGVLKTICKYNDGVMEYVQRQFVSNGRNIKTLAIGGDTYIALYKVGSQAREHGPRSLKPKNQSLSFRAGYIPGSMFKPQTVALTQSFRELRDLIERLPHSKMVITLPSFNGCPSVEESAIERLVQSFDNRTYLMELKQRELPSL